MSGGLAKFDVHTNGGGLPRISVNGHHVPTVKAYRVEGHLGEPPSLTLQLVAGGTLEGEGVVRVVEPGEVDPGPTIAAFLRGLDPVQIEQTALDRSGWGSGPLTAEVLAILVDIAEGRG